MNSGIRICWWMGVMHVLLCLGQSDDGFSDENRPYEFGFNIEGYQHRHEKKDENGIIMGEFGFITADGVYHITVYATDENGDFKILKMKNIKIGLPMDRMTTPVPPVTSKPTPKINTVSSVTLVGVNGCAGCKVPTVAPGSPVGITGSQPGPIAGSGLTTRPITGSSSTPRPISTSGFPIGPVTVSSFITPRPITTSGFPAGPTTPSGFTQRPTTSPGIHGPNTSHRPAPGPGATSQVMPQVNMMSIADLMGSLYKFNYTLTYHGHHETGDRAGNKKGEYFFDSRDGFRRKTSYIANEFGYQPNITLIELDPEGTPKEETEKLLTKLKGYEFKWFDPR